MPVETLIQVRRGTNTNWSTVNPTLSSGEFGFESNTGRLKIGNGSQAWNVLPYLPDTLDALLDVIITSPLNGQLLQFNGTNWVNATPPTGEPIGHTDKTQSVMSFDKTTRTFSISPASASFEVWCVGQRFTFTTTQSVQIPNTSGLYYIYFSSSGVLSQKTTFFTWDADAPTAYVYWNATDGEAYFFADERHGITLDWQTHEYLHRTRGAAYASGFSIGAYTITGTGSANADMQLDIADGTFFDEDLQVDITHSASPTANTWQQVLQGGAEIPIFYRSGSVWKRTTPTKYPLKQGTLAQYNLNTAGTWSTPDLATNKYGVTWIVATNNLNYPVIGIMGQNQYDNLNKVAEDTWAGLDLANLPIFEIRPLWKVAYLVSSGFTNTPKAAIREVVDLRVVGSTATGLPVTPTDHGSLYGLSDDDHTQYFNQTRGDARYVQLTGNALTATTLQTSRLINGTAFNGSADITTSNWGTARTITIGATGKSVNGSTNVSWTTTEMGVEDRAPLGVPRFNLGDPTLREMALFDAQNNNKTEFHPIASIFVESSTDGVNWTTFSVTDQQKRRLIGGDINSSIDIPYGTAFFRIRLRAVSYVWLESLYMYAQTAGHTCNLKIFRKHDLDASWTQHTSSNVQGSVWPGHIFLPFTSIKWWNTATQGLHDHEIYVLFTPAWNATYSANPISLYRMQWWGGYPAGKRNLYTTDENQNASFPATLSATGFSGPLTGNASTATTLQTARTIAGSSFNGSANINIDANNLSGTTLNSGITASSLTSVGTLTSLTSSGMIRGPGGEAIRLGGSNPYVAFWDASIATRVGYLQGVNGSDMRLVAEAGTLFCAGSTFAVRDGTMTTNRLIVNSNGTSIQSGWLEIPYAGTPTTDGNASIRVTSDGTKTGISIKSASASNVPDFFTAFYDTANGSSAVGSIFSPASTATTTYSTTSDYRLKRDDTPLTGSLDRIMSLRPISYRWKFPDSPLEEGFFAHEVQEIVPCVTFGEKDAEDADGNIIPQQIELSRLVPVLVGAVQELNARITELEARQ